MNNKIKNEELNRPGAKEYMNLTKTPMVVVLDNIRSLNNIGSVFRTSDAFLVEKVFLCGITAQPPHRDIHKTALGSTETVAWQYTETTQAAITQLKEEGYTIIGIEQTEESIPLNKYTPEKDQKLALILGHEVNGVDQAIINLCDLCLEIPQEGTKHSLNISVAAGIVIWDLYAKL